MKREPETGTYLSFTRSNMYLRCPAQYEFRYIRGIIRPGSGALVIGKSVHDGAAHALEVKAEFGALPDLDETLDVFDGAWNEYADDEIDWDGEDPGNRKDAAARAMSVWHDSLAPVIQPASVDAVEYRMRTRLFEKCCENPSVSADGSCDVCGGGSPYDLLAYADCVDENANVRDLKTGKRLPRENDPGHRLQLATYAAQLRDEDGLEERTGIIDGVITERGPRTVLDARSVDHPITKGEQDWTLNLHRKVALSIEKGNFPPNPNGWHCSPKWCGYYSECRGGC